MPLQRQWNFYSRPLDCRLVAVGLDDLTGWFSIQLYDLGFVIFIISYSSLSLYVDIIVVNIRHLLLHSYFGFGILI